MPISLRCRSLELLRDVLLFFFSILCVCVCVCVFKLLGLLIIVLCVKSPRFQLGRYPYWGKYRHQSCFVDYPFQETRFSLPLLSVRVAKKEKGYLFKFERLLLAHFTQTLKEKICFLTHISFYACKNDHRSLIIHYILIVSVFFLSHSFINSFFFFTF